MEDDLLHAYEVKGLRENGEVYAVEILGYLTYAAAVARAQSWADLWQATVDLVRVPYVDTGDAHWWATEVEFVEQLVPSRPIGGL